MMYAEDDDPCMCDPCVCTSNCTVTGEPNVPIVKRQSIPVYRGEIEGEGDEIGLCTCDPCECETPPGSPAKTITEAPEVSEAVDLANAFQLDEFSRAKAYFLNTSTKSGVSLYDHLSDVIRKLLDDRAPNNPVDYFEEVSMNVKRYRFTQGRDVLKDVFYISEPILNDAKFLTSNWKKYSQWSTESRKDAGEGNIVGSFQNLLRLQYYLEQVNIGLPREEMFRLALAIKDLTASRPFITRARFWGKVFGTLKNYYVVEAEFTEPGSGDGDMWRPNEESGDAKSPDAIKAGEEKVPGPQETFERAGNVVLDSNFLAAYSKTSGLPPEKQAMFLPKAKAATPEPPAQTDNEWGGEDAQQQPIPFEDLDGVADYAKWRGYQEELMTMFPGIEEIQEIEIPQEPAGTGVNRRAFYVCNELGLPWTMLPLVTPKQINGSRQIRWNLTGDLNSNIRSFPVYPGKEGHFFKALLARAAAGSLASPKGFYKTRKYAGEFDGEDDEVVEEEEEETSSPSGNDKVYPTKKYRAQMSALTNPKLDFWVHHASSILPQGRNVWWNPAAPSKAKRITADTSEDEESEDEDEEFEGEGKESSGKEVGPALFTSISKDITSDGRKAWTLQTSSSVFTEFQVVAVRSNTWPGSSVICTTKGKVDNIYLGDGLKFADRSYAPPAPENPMREYRAGPELEELDDPSVEEEQKWLTKLELTQIADIEPRFEDNEDDLEDEDEETDEEY